MQILNISAVCNFDNLVLLYRATTIKKIFFSKIKVKKLDRIHVTDLNKVSRSDTNSLIAII